MSPKQLVKRACDACHRRKIKCVTILRESCYGCQSAGLRCTYDIIPQPKGPKTARNKILSEPREAQRYDRTAVLTQQSFKDHHQQCFSARDTELLSTETVSACIEYFFAFVYRTQPVIFRESLTAAVAMMHQDDEAYCLVVSLCALTMTKAELHKSSAFFGIPATWSRTRIELIDLLLKEALGRRKRFDSPGNSTVWSIVTSFFLSDVFNLLDKQHSAWFQLREATTLACILNMHCESTYQMVPDAMVRSHMRCLYWILLVMERMYALQDRRPLTLHPTIRTPFESGEVLEAVDTSGFHGLINMLKPFDEIFVGICSLMGPGTLTTALVELRCQLIIALPLYLEGMARESTIGPCLHTWLGEMINLLSFSGKYVQWLANADDPVLLRIFELCKESHALATTVPPQLERYTATVVMTKIFEVACTLKNVLTCAPTGNSVVYESGRLLLDQYITLSSAVRDRLCALERRPDALPQGCWPYDTRACQHRRGR